jgi:TRAP-type C4-dicarboxylate transport system substrate-binding protein
MNAKKWQELPAPVKEKILQTMPGFETDMVKYYDQEIAKERDLMIKGGARFIKLEPNEAKKFMTMAYDAWWEFMMTKVPDQVPNLKKMTGN